MKENPKPFIPGWLNMAGLSQAEFRLYCYLASRADNATGIAWPQAATIAGDCAMAKNTVWKSLRALEGRDLIHRVGKPFQGTNRYRILTLPIGANGIPIEGATSANEIPIEDTPIGANESHQSAQMATHQSAQMAYREGTPMKGIQRRVSNKKVAKEKLDLPFPSKEFSEAWQQWEQYRKEKRKPITPTSAKMQFKEFLVMGEARAIAAINHSITKDWQGIFEPEGNGSNGTQAVNMGKRFRGIIENIELI
jgi:hypothetical protein